MKIKILKMTSVIFLLTFLSYGCSANNEEFTKIKFDLTFKNMELIPSNINSQENSELTLNITSDIDGKLHIHGYDIEGNISKNKISKLTIKLNATGNFPIAFHSEEQHDDISKHGALFESDIIMSGESFSYTLQQTSSGKIIRFHDHMSHDLTGEIMVMEKGNPSEIKIFYENGSYSQSKIMAASSSIIIWENNSQNKIKIVSGPPPGNSETNHSHKELIVGNLIVNPK
jgi:uncharacterized protein YcfL